MATGRGNYLTKQTGEYLVAAELSRRGYVATTFTGNLPHYDIVAIGQAGIHALVQVKTITADKLQLDAGHFAFIDFEGHRQVVRGVRPDPYPGLFLVVARVVTAASAQRDRFFVLPWHELACLVASHHQQVLAAHGGIRPRNWESLHSAFNVDRLERWEGRWEALSDRVAPVSASKEES